MADEPAPPRRYQFSLKLLFGAIAASAIECGILFGSPLVIGVVATECFLVFLSVAGAIVVYDELRADATSALNVAIAGWIACSSIAVGVFLVFAVIDG